MERTFLNDVLLASDTIKQKFNQTKNVIDIQENIIWNNKSIKINNKSIFYEDWYKIGVKFIQQLYDYRNGTFFTFNDMKYLYNISNNDYLK